MTREIKHISVCICTFKRPALLRRLLSELDHQQTDGLFIYSVVVADNDHLQSAWQVVADSSATSSYPAIYCMEPEQNIALARNKALENAQGHYIAFIDDDEIPSKNWLCNLFKTCMEYNADGVLGPVKPYFEHDPPQWVVKGKFYERPVYDTGYKLNWPETRTGNVLFKKEILNESNNAFKAEFGTGSEDIDFFRRMIEKGFTFVWCNEAIVYELVPPSRCSLAYLLRRALLRGSTFPMRRAKAMRSLAKSLIAVPVYTLFLPILVLGGQQTFYRYLIKLFDHASRILAFIGVRVIKDRDSL
jgi:succinoglycan biosynthesis protein ExoM